MLKNENIENNSEYATDTFQNQQENFFEEEESDETIIDLYLDKDNLNDDDVNNDNLNFDEEINNDFNEENNNNENENKNSIENENNEKNNENNNEKNNENNEKNNENNEIKNNKKKQKKFNNRKKKKKISIVAKDKKNIEKKNNLNRQELINLFSQKLQKKKYKKRSKSNPSTSSEKDDEEEKKLKKRNTISSQIINNNSINLKENEQNLNEEKNIKKKKKKKKLKPVVTYSLKLIKEKAIFNEHLIKVRKLFNEKKFVPEEKYFTYIINPGNASYLIKNCFQHRINWKESFMSVSSLFNFKWQQSTMCIEYNNLSQIESIPQIVNHFEYHSSLSNKSNMFINLFDYCEKNNINIFKYVPFTIIINNNNNNSNTNEENFINLFNNINNYIFDYENIKIITNKELKKQKDKLYSTYFNLIFRENNELQLGGKTQIMIPKTHFANKNYWVIKATNLNRGQCIRIVDSIDKLKEIIKTFSQGIKYSSITKENNENNFQINFNNLKQSIENKQNNIKNIPSCDTYKPNKIIIQKYIEKPMLYYGRKCDMRIWVLLTHEMKYYFFKEGHLKTCSANYDLNNNKDAFIHITNYSFQKHCEGFEKFELGNEVPFYDFQKFLNKYYKGKSIENDIFPKIKEIISLTMNSVKDKINMKKRNFCFEIFGYDFMIDCDFNVFLIEINTNPGLEESSPWIKVIVPRMLDDALRLTLDQLFETKYDFGVIKKNRAKEEIINYNNILNIYNKINTKYQD